MIKNLLIILLIAFVPLTGYSQSGSLSKKEQRNLLKEEKKRLAAEKAAIEFNLSSQLIETGKFVLETDMVTDRRGFTRSADPIINFILVDSLYGMIQLGSRTGEGLNGVGGITIEGEIVNYTVEKNEKKNFLTVEYEIKTMVSGYYRIKVYTHGGMRAEARFSGSMSMGQMRYSGRLVSLEQSRVYKGTSYY
ncbi:DUF4251 domain-containing protein [Bacteroidota bacterium]